VKVEEIVTLNLYRRHTTNCTKGYSRNERIHRPITKGQRSRDCECPISVEGELKFASVQNRSTGKDTWDEADDVAKQWVAWGRPEAPVVEEKPPSVEAAIAAFLAIKKLAVEDSTYRAFVVLLNKRLLPFARQADRTLIREFSELHLTTQFVGSWVSLSDNEPLKDTSRTAELERLRAFYRFCVSRKWMTENPAMSKDLRVKTKVAKKFGMSVEEERRVFEAIPHFTDKRGLEGQYNAEELYTFCLAMRTAGLRISDATALNHVQIQPRQSGHGWAIHMKQAKTGEFVYVPITNTLYERLQRLTFKGERAGRKYWFWTAKGKLGTAKNNWYTKISKILDTVHEAEPFIHPVTPHTFRHTFSIRHLNAGVNIEIVSKWLGHASIAVTQKHYSHAIRATMIASETAFDASLERQAV